MEDLILNDSESFVYESLETGEIISGESVETEVDDVVYGRVVECNKLNLRSEPSTDSKIVSKLNTNDTVVVDLEESSDEFYKIYTEIGIEGFCMKRFIEIE